MALLKIYTTRIVYLWAALFLVLGIMFATSPSSRAASLSGFNCCQENKLPPPRAEIDCRQYPICRPYGCLLACRGWGYTGVGFHCISKKNPMKDECCCDKDPRHGATPLV
ncbi:hypothetical protein BDA96_05G155500 [Sorghum bicolor]|uniref:Uncharacterized protein n=2 Tax=Sorghum bicolor TaxID=4558 RepID=A0A921UFJ1_SORBI|nr:hypothetical protein BDA96_05G155500 [Sorghum bicolor]KXG28592.1 hypothetical protein SORBI_3005G141600 [Sorghum bicolor]